MSDKTTNSRFRANSSSFSRSRLGAAQAGLLLFFVSLLVGCQSFTTQWNGDLWRDADEPVIPEEMVAIWTDTVLHQPNQPGIRGFGGRVYFYAKPDDDPIEVDGTLTVYVFDAAHKNPDQERPRKKYVITPDQLSKHYSKTKIGHSYSVWIPWDKVGGPSVQLSLVARFDGRDGGTVVSSASDKLLPGVLTAVTPASGSNASPSANSSSPEGVNAPRGTTVGASANSNVQAVGFAGNSTASSQVTPAVGLPSSPTLQGTESLPTFDIELPPSFQQRLRQVTTEAERPAPSPTLSSPAATSGSIAAPGSVMASEVMASGVGSPAVPTPAVPPADTPTAATSPGFRSAPARFPARREPRVQPVRDPLRRLPHPAGWPSELPRTPRADAGTSAGTAAAGLDSVAP